MHLETLESRQLRSGTVIEGYPGYFEVHGDDSDDVIAIDFTPDGGFTLDGATYGGVAYISIYSYGGDDIISVGAGPTYVGASVDSGSGNDVVTLNVAGAVWAGPGSDTVRLTDSFRG